jgi:hypothetical protein
MSMAHRTGAAAAAASFSRRCRSAYVPALLEFGGGYPRYLRINQVIAMDTSPKLVTIGIEIDIDKYVFGALDAVGERKPRCFN